MRKIVYFGTSGNDRKIGIYTKNIVLCHHPNFPNGVRVMDRWKVWHENVLKRKRVK